MKIQINIEDHNTGFTFTDNEGNILDYNTMSRADQLMVLRVLSDAWVMFGEHLNREWVWQNMKLKLDNYHYTIGRCCVNCQHCTLHYEKMSLLFAL